MACPLCSSNPPGSPPCPLCSVPVSWEQARQTKPTKPATRTTKTAPSTPKRQPVMQSQRGGPMGPPRVTVCGARDAGAYLSSNGTRFCNLHAGHSGTHVAVGGATWTDAPRAPSKPTVSIAPPTGTRTCGALHPTTKAPCTSHPQHAFPHYDADGNRWLADGRILEGKGAKTWNPDDNLPPALASVKTTWEEIPVAHRAPVVEQTRASFKSGDVTLGIYRTCLIANPGAFPGRKAELAAIDERATLARHVTQSDDTRRWAIFQDAVREIGFDPRQDESPAPTNAPEIDGKALVAELLGLDS